jgi:GT2 family glycosyltransferase|uniref:Glycosyltransferase n=1 Tax=Mesoaciditoga lauensis TaxID=1495039 RepID=A0A7V3RFE7_9BACT
MKIAIVVVTYNRLDWLKKNIKALTSQTRVADEIIVVDNASTDGTQDFLKTLLSKTMKIERLNENIGGAGGFSYGLHCAIEDGADWVWMMDDDAIPYDSALERLENAISRSRDERIGVFLSKIVKTSNEKGDEKLSYVSVGTFVGFTVSKEVVKKIGLPDPDFFIYADDYEYSIRIRRAGFKIVRVNSSLIEHKDWVKQKHLFRFPFTKPSIPSWKVYYIFRNPLIATNHSKIIRSMVKLYLFIDKYVWSYVDPKAKPYAFKGFADGKKGIKGKIIDPKMPKI